jgi:hypothetical protein
VWITLDNARDGSTTPELLSPSSPSCSSDSSSDEAVSPRSSLRGDTPPPSVRVGKRAPKGGLVIVPPRFSSIDTPLTDWLLHADALLVHSSADEGSDTSSLASWRTPIEEPSPEDGSLEEDAGSTSDDDVPLTLVDTFPSPPPRRVPVPSYVALSSSVPQPWRFDDLCSLSCTSTAERVRRYEARLAALRAEADGEWWLRGEADEDVVVDRARRAVMRLSPRRVPCPRV